VVRSGKGRGRASYITFLKMNWPLNSYSSHMSLSNLYYCPIVSKYVQYLITH